jgi:type VI secretion system secreted protein VgrG
VQAVLAGAPFRPAQRTPKPRIVGVQCAVVVGPKGEEIHTDELGRVRVQFAWDRVGRRDDASSCWVRVSQGWGGASFGMAMIPRIGHEVLVGFADGDPDLPFVVGRMYNTTAPVPHALPQSQTISTWKSDSSPGSEGFNEIRYDDAKGEELVYQQAERNQRCLVKNDETITVGRDRDKKVEGSETDTTHGHRTEVTKERRKATTFGSQVGDLRSNRSKLVAKDEREESRSNRTVRVRGDLDVVTFGTKKERVEGDAHTRVVSSRTEHTGANHSLTVVEDQHEEVGATYSLASGETMHLLAGDTFCSEATDLTLKGPGGFVRLHAGGVTIGGTLVKINTGGRSMTGRGVRAREPGEAKVADVLGEDVAGEGVAAEGVVGEGVVGEGVAGEGVAGVLRKAVAKAEEPPR